MVDSAGEGGQQWPWGGIPQVQARRKTASGECAGGRGVAADGGWGRLLRHTSPLQLLGGLGFRVR